MATPLVVPVDLHVNGNASFKTLSVPPGTVDNAGIKALAAIDASKVIHQRAIQYYQKSGIDVVTETVPLHIFRAVGEILSVEVAPIIAPAGGDKQFTIDIQKGNAGSAFATVLAAPITVDSGSADRTVEAGVVSVPAVADNDILQAVITASGSTGTQAQGLILVILSTEAPQ